MILVDSSVLIDFLKGRKSISTKKLEEIIERNIPFGITSFIYQEILQGAKTLSEFNLLQEYLSTQLFYHPIDKTKSYEKSAKIFFNLRRKGITIRSTIDCLIAQIAKENNLFLLHNDKDFKPICELVKVKEY